MHRSSGHGPAGSLDEHLPDWHRVRLGLILLALEHRQQEQVFKLADRRDGF